MPNVDENKAQFLPVRVYQNDAEIMLAAPLPGLEPENITVKIDGERLMIQGERRGPRRSERDLLMVEWAISPYHRELSLPVPVSGSMSNATHGNGVLVLTMPKVQAGVPNEPAEFRLQPATVPYSERVGHAGRALLKTTTEMHRRKKEGPNKSIDRQIVAPIVQLEARACLHRCPDR